MLRAEIELLGERVALAFPRANLAPKRGRAQLDEFAGAMRASHWGVGSARVHVLSIHKVRSGSHHANGKEAAINGATELVRRVGAVSPTFSQGRAARND